MIIGLSQSNGFIACFRPTWPCAPAIKTLWSVTFAGVGFTTGGNGSPLLDKTYELQWPRSILKSYTNNLFGSEMWLLERCYPTSCVFTCFLKLLFKCLCVGFLFRSLVCLNSNDLSQWFTAGINSCNFTSECSCKPFSSRGSFFCISSPVFLHLLLKIYTKTWSIPVSEALLFPAVTCDG